MFLKHKTSGDMVEVMDLSGLFDPCVGDFQGRYHAGEEMPDPEVFNKVDLAFPSGEALPRCWMDPNYRSS